MPSNVKLEEKLDSSAELDGKKDDATKVINVQNDVMLVNNENFPGFLEQSEQGDKFSSFEKHWWP